MLIASLFVQLFALVTPLFFQVVVDKVLSHKGYSTLFVLVGGMAAIGVFDVVLQYLRTYALSHTTNRIDVELGQRLFGHLLRLPLAYFETRSAGQTVARVRELETIRSFLTGQGLFSAIDLVFAFVFIAVLFAYSAKLTLIVLAAIPLYLIIGFAVRPILREQIKEKFNRGAASQQFLVEAIVGRRRSSRPRSSRSCARNGRRSSPPMCIPRSRRRCSARAARTRIQYVSKRHHGAAILFGAKLAAYVHTSFAATMLGARGQNAIQYVSKLTTAALLLFGAKAVIDGELTVGALSPST